MELLLSLSVALAVAYWAWWRQPVFPLLGMAAAIAYGLWRGGIGGAVFGTTAALINASFLILSIWTTRRRTLSEGTPEIS